MQYKNNKQIDIEDKTKQDFENEWQQVNFPYKSHIDNNEVFKIALYDEFTSLTPKPKQSLYIYDFLDIKALHKELKETKIPTIQNRNGNVAVAAGFIATVENPLKLLPLGQMKLTPLCHFKLTPLFRLKLTP
jgi:hypothetical protein